MKVLLTAMAVLVAAGVVKAASIETQALPSLDKAISNNAVTLVKTKEGVYLYSFLGLGGGKTWQDISSEALVLEPGATGWTELAPVPGKSGRLAASAVTVAGAAWLFGGYTVTADGSEASTTGVYTIRPGETHLRWVTDMPVSVEDSVMLSYQDRFIYLFSGWHDLGNINLVQVLDTKTLQWAQATPWPGAPVFGHAGGISNGRILICDGVKIQYPDDESPRKFLPSDDCWAGRIDAKNHRRIDWHSVPAHPGPARYRMAAAGVADNAGGGSRVVFAGGSDNPYNFNGIGYNGVPADAGISVFSYDFSSFQWQCHGDLPKASMDHRGLPYTEGWFYLIGGMQTAQTPVKEVLRFTIENTMPCHD